MVTAAFRAVHVRNDDPAVDDPGKPLKAFMNPLIAEHLGRSGLNRSDPGWTRIIIEKPFGRDLNSAVSLNSHLLQRFHEDQIAAERDRTVKLVELLRQKPKQRFARRARSKGIPESWAHISSDGYC